MVLGGDGVVATELLFFGAGAPIWEVVERGGSYAAPIVVDRSAGGVLLDARR